MLDLWYSENWSDETKFSIKVKEHIYSEQTPFQKIDFLYLMNMEDFYIRWTYYDNGER